MKKYWINDEMFQQGFYLIPGCSVKDLDKYLTKEYGVVSELSNCAVGSVLTMINTEDDTTVVYLWIKELHWTIKGQSTLIHELSHLVFRNLERAMISHSRETDEVFAYYIQHFFKQIHSKLAYVSRSTKTRDKKRNKVLEKRKK